MSARAEPRLVGDGVIWLLVLVELLTFGILFLSFAVARWREPGVFLQGQGALSLSTGALNTLLLVGASWCAARAVMALRAGLSAAGGWWLLGALGGAVGFLVVKSHEFAGKIASGFDWADDSFTMLYTLLTGFHFLHVLVGAVVFGVLGWHARQGAYGPQHLNAPESGAVFWHMVDLLWMVLFALVYVIR
ncbi:cytochrome-c oxidase [Hydrogenophaga crassostreae]|uniref:Cytochrome-c oxidase n=1 Tax=Hydrogenophaga crassostreae TaxID=1763535 RepID=A0A167IVK7_9BURK|nr:cytochrome c oxidase subunit 3 [Hydrogenophaga crassostreae]AOW14319.1 cytochrome-c oxidase [Hydrogenophaga crassostreae]OAD43659.1 cytochrome-c oxidase [Hydrogenophaga crassostreae]